MSKWSQRTALVTGASAGFGAEFARQLAGEVGELILVARRRERLEALAKELQDQHPGLKVQVRPCDLADAAARKQLLADLQADGAEVSLLVNNAGLGDIGDVISADWAKLDLMLQVNMVALTQLTRALVPAMRERGEGTVLNVSSTAGFLPLPAFAVYAATKAYVNSFSEALRFELKGTGVSVTALCPGPAQTEFGDVAARPDGKRQFAPPAFLMLPAERIVADALTGARAGKARVVPGILVRLPMLVVESIPRPWLRAILGVGDWVMTRFGGAG